MSLTTQVNYDAKEKIWRGSKMKPKFDPNSNVGLLILNELKKTPDMVTQVSADTGVEVTCEMMRRRTITIARHLHESGYKQHDVVGFVASNCEHLAPVVFACFTLGLPINPLAPVMTESDLIHIYSKTKPKIIFCDAPVISLVQNAVNKMKLNSKICTFMDKVDGYEFVDDILSAATEEDEFKFPELVDIANTTLKILCSSGSTGLAKGVSKSHKQGIHQLHPIWNYASKEPKKETLFGFSTIYWGTGTYFLIIGTLYGCKRIITTKNFDISLAIDICNRYQVTVYTTAPYAVLLMLKSPELKPFKTVQVFIAVGAVMPEKLVVAFEPFLPKGKVCPIYATTEGDYIGDSMSTQRYGSCGQPSPNVEMKISDANGKCLGPNEIGEICIRTPVHFSGYFGEPEKTAETFINGWVHTGDVGYLDDDCYLFIVDRKKEMLSYNNYQVYPSELETIINEVEGVVNSCVSGITQESDGDDLIFALVVRNEKATKVTGETIASYVAGKVIDAKRIRGGVHFVETLPLNPSGKIQRSIVKDMVREIYKKFNK